MGLSEKELEHVAEVARIKLTSDELKSFTKQANDIIDWFLELSNINTNGVEPSFHPLKTINVMREDEVGECFTKDEVFGNTKHKEKGFFKGPRIV